jgi:hypothetical protein
MAGGVTEAPQSGVTCWDTMEKRSNDFKFEKVVRIWSCGRIA